MWGHGGLLGAEGGGGVGVDGAEDGGDGGAAAEAAIAREEEEAWGRQWVGPGRRGRLGNGRRVGRLRGLRLRRRLLWRRWKGD